MQTNCNEVVVLQQSEHSSVNNSRSAGIEVTGTKKGSNRNIGENEEKEKESEGAVEKRTFNYFLRPRLKT